MPQPCLFRRAQISKENSKRMAWSSRFWEKPKQFTMVIYLLSGLCVGYVGYIWLYGCNGLWNCRSKYRVIPIAPKKTFFRRACWLPLQNNLRLHAYTDTYNMWIYIYIYTCKYMYIYILYSHLYLYIHMYLHICDLSTYHPTSTFSEDLLPSKKHVYRTSDTKHPTIQIGQPLLLFWWPTYYLFKNLHPTIICSFIIDFSTCLIYILDHTFLQASWRCRGPLTSSVWPSSSSLFSWFSWRFAAASHSAAPGYTPGPGASSLTGAAQGRMTSDIANLQIEMWYHVVFMDDKYWKIT